MVDSLAWLEQKVWADDGTPHDYLGTGFAMSGDVALAGSQYAPGPAGDNQGAVYVFTKANGIWTQTQKLTAGDPVSGAFFGESVALDGNTAIIGADGVAVGGAAVAGAAYVFQRAGDGTWSQTQKLTASDTQSQSGFGMHLALTGDTAVISASYASVNTNAQQGKVYVFKRNDAGLFVEAQQLVASDGASSSYFGVEAALQENTIFIGATNSAVSSNGTAYVFTETDGTWGQTQELSASDGASGDLFGWAIALSGSTALIGAEGADIDGVADGGAVYVFSKTDNQWTQTQKLTIGDGNAYANFGASVALLGPTAIIGAPQVSINGNANQGAAYVFTESSDGVWAQTDKLVASDGSWNNYYGWTVVFDGWTAGVAAIGATVPPGSGNSLQGAVYLNARSGADPHTVTPAVVDGSGTVSPDTPQSITDGTTATFTLTPNTAYRVDSVGGTCVGTLDGDTYTTVPVTADCTVEIHFGPIEQIVTPSVQGGNGAITPDTPQSVNYGDTLSFTLTPDAGYVSGAVGGTCGGALLGDTFTTHAVTTDCTVIATFRNAQHTVTPSVAGGNGSISPDTSQTIDDSATTTFTLLPDPGFMVASVDGTCGGTLDGNTFTTSPVIDDCTVVASYTTAHYTVTPALATGHGTIAPGLPQSAGYGDMLVFTVTPDPSYVGSVGGTCGGTLAGTTYTTAPITASCTVEASFTLAVTHTVTPSVAGSHGAIAPATPQSVIDGSSITFTLLPDSGYAVEAVGGSCGGTLAGNTYTTAVIVADCTVEASFAVSPDVIFANGFD